MGQFAENVLAPGTEPSDTDSSTDSGTGSSTDPGTDSGNGSYNEGCTEVACHQIAGLEKVREDFRYFYLNI